MVSSLKNFKHNIAVINIIILYIKYSYHQQLVSFLSPIAAAAKEESESILDLPKVLSMALCRRADDDVEPALTAASKLS